MKRRWLLFAPLLSLLNVRAGRATASDVRTEAKRLPQSLGGSGDLREPITWDIWRPIPGYAVVRLNGDRLPLNLVEWLANVDVVGDVPMRLRFYDVTNCVARGEQLEVRGVGDITVQRVERLSPGTADYRLECRMSSAVSGRGANHRSNGGYILNALVDVPDVPVGAVQHGQRRQDFTGDGSTRRYPLQYRVDRIIEVAVDGVSFSVGSGEAWSIDAVNSVLVQASTETPLTSRQSVMVLYNYTLPLWP